MKRQLLWNMKAEMEEERIKYFFVIINDNRETRVISQRILENLAPVDEFQERQGKADNLNYKLMTFYSPMVLDNNSLFKIYAGTKKRDNRLYDRHKNGINSLEEYVQKEISK